MFVFTVEFSGDKIAIIGDLHGRWDDRDNAYFDSADYDLLLFLGDLGSGSRKNGLDIIKQISRLRVPALVLPGNNDAPHLAALKAELAHQAGKLELYRVMGKTRRREVRPCGFSVHGLTTAAGPVSLVVGRPCSMGGSEFSFPEQMARNFGVSSFEESARRLCDLVDQASSEDVVFLAHNGPTGLGEAPTDLWGRDFEIRATDQAQAPRDWGDPDLRAAIEHARAAGKRVLGVIAGHMHRRPRGKSRPLCVRQHGVSYVNPAVVPRVFSGDSGFCHHHVELRLDLGADSPEGRFRITEHFVAQ